MTREKLVRIWFGGVRSTSDAGERELPEAMCMTSLQRAMLRILLRQDACDLLSLCIRETENISMKEAKEIRDSLYCELMEDAIAGIWSGEENLMLARFLESCSEGIGDTDDFCTFFLSALGESRSEDGQEIDTIARRVKKNADECLNAFIQERRKLQIGTDSEDGPPPGLDEFEYIDWLITH